jgi:hypothetical protein
LPLRSGRAGVDGLRRAVRGVVALLRERRGTCVRWLGRVAAVPPIADASSAQASAHAMAGRWMRRAANTVGSWLGSAPPAGCEPVMCEARTLHAPNRPVGKRLAEINAQVLPWPPTAAEIRSNPVGLS